MGESVLRIEDRGKIPEKCAMSASVRDLKVPALVALRNLRDIGGFWIVEEILKRDDRRNMSSGGA